GLVAGTYSVTVSDVNSCTATGSYTVTQPVVLLANVSGTNETCNETNNGTAASAPTGGTSPYTYIWNNDATSSSLTGLVAGTYSVTVTDANGCTATGSYTVTQPELLIVSATSTAVSCTVGQGTSNNGTITITASGGSGALQYSIDNGVSFFATNVFTALTAGTYQIVVMDANNCQTTDTEIVTSPPAIVAGTCEQSNDGCQVNVGEIKVSASGGTGTLNVTWSGTPVAPFGGPVTGTPPGTAQAIPVEGFIIYSGLSGNTTYKFKVTDGNGCMIGEN
ncbi:MAG: SprB repeat-containing protein, partial [Saprospiraceae bacterium]|nr:SprB repeat-containing protein [Saprospiraceae bacterium]